MGFFYNLNVTSITIGDNVQFKNNSMYNAFASCVRLNSPVTIPNSVTNISNAFSGCTYFNQPVTIPDGCEDMSNAFRNCRNFNQPVTIPSSVTNAMRMFSGCNNFNSPVTIPNGVTTMLGLFAECNGYNRPTTIPNGVTTTQYLFGGCASFNQSVDIPESVTTCAEMFGDCTNMAGNIYVRPKDWEWVWGSLPPTYRMLVGKNNAKRVNIFVPRNSKTNSQFYYSGKEDGASGMLGANITWSTMTNCYYNTAYNVYVYYNL